MADYRQSCANPACGYTGFSGHVDGCYVVAQSIAREKARRAEEKRLDEEGRAYWSVKSEEEFFAELKALEDEISAAEKLHIQRNFAYDVLRDQWLLRKYLDYRRTTSGD
jgi:hypothetical protein